MEASFWVKDNIAKQVQELIRKHNLKFKYEPLHINNEFNFTITGDIHDYENFQVDFWNLERRENEEIEKEEVKKFGASFMNICGLKRRK